MNRYLNPECYCLKNLVHYNPDSTFNCITKLDNTGKSILLIYMSMKLEEIKRSTDTYITVRSAVEAIYNSIIEIILQLMLQRFHVKIHNYLLTME